MENLQETLKANGITLYTADFQQDYFLVSWWGEMAKAQELQKTLGTAAETLGDLYRYFNGKDRLLFFKQDPKTQNITFAAWIEPITTGGKAAYFGTWTSQTKRGTPEQHRVLSLFYQLAFQQVNVLIGLTRPELKELHEKLGYIVLGDIPEMFAANAGTIVYLTRENFFASRLYNVVA